jgi:hypothetical protein
VPQEIHHTIEANSKMYMTMLESANSDSGFAILASGNDDAIKALT